jgi:hypothetical protein
MRTAGPRTRVAAADSAPLFLGTAYVYALVVTTHLAGTATSPFLRVARLDRHG